MTVKIEAIDPNHLNPDEWEPITPPKQEVKHRNNQALTNEIVKHVFADLGVFADRRVSICNDAFLSDKAIVISDGNSQQTFQIWGCEATIGSQRLSMIATKMDTYNEAVLLVMMEKCPLYGAFLADDCDIGVMVKDHWAPANTFIQASFLAGMEQLRDLGTPFQKANDIRELVKHMKTYIATYDGA